MLEIDDTLSIPTGALTFHATRAGGPGGQHVNKTSSAVRLHFDTNCLSEPIRARLQRRHPGCLTQTGILILRADGSRSQRRNRRELLRRLKRAIRQAAVEPVQRRPRLITPQSHARRLHDKRHRAQLKRLRARQPLLQQVREAVDL